MIFRRERGVGFLLVSNTRVTSVIYRWALVALFLLAISLPLLDWRFDLDPGLALSENRSSAQAPAWPQTTAQWKALPAALQTYWNDAFGLRRRLIHWHSLADYELGVSGTPNVVIGAHSWLFYTGEDTFEQHRGQRPLAPAQLAQWAEQLEARRLWLRRRGAQYLFVIAPDKQTIYPDQVPARYRPFTRTTADEIVSYLRAHTQVDVLDLRPTLRAARADGAVFAKTDSHWNDRGAVAAYTAMAERLQAWFPRSNTRTPNSFVRSAMPPWNGDLALMLPGLYDRLIEMGEQWQPNPLPAAQQSNDNGYIPTESRGYSLYVAPRHPQLPRAVVFHDSFLLAPDERMWQPPPAGALAPPPAKLRLRLLLAELFSRSAFTWQLGFDLKLIEHEHPDVVIQETVERSLLQGPQGAVAPALPAHD
jgi:alginate O-acetyltransferase complex protein AlgJ